MHDALEGIFVQWPFYTSIPIKISFGSQDGICRIPSLRPMRRNYTVSCEGLFIRSRDFHRTKFVTTCIPEYFLQRSRLYQGLSRIFSLT